MYIYVCVYVYVYIHIHKTFVIFKYCFYMAQSGSIYSGLISITSVHGTLEEEDDMNGESSMETYTLMYVNR